MRVLSIDPGYDRVGIAVLEKKAGKESLLYSTCCVTNRDDALPTRLVIIGKTLEEVIAEYAPTELAIEKTFFSKNKKTAIAVSEARGMILYIGAVHKLRITEYSPQEIKIAVTGYGNADKAQVASMLEQILPLSKDIEFDDEYDAIAVGITHLATPTQGGQA